MSLKIKKFNILKQQFEQDEFKSIEGKIRLYENKDGKKYPSITSVLANTKDAETVYALEKWKEFVGEKEAERIKNYSTHRGDLVHNLLEDYVLGREEFEENYYASSPKIQRLFNQIKNILDEKVTTIHLVEKPLFSDKLKTAGRVDMIAEYDGKVCIVDFKTAEKRKDKSMVLDYFIQETFYAIAYQEKYGIPVEGIVTLIATEKSTTPVVYVENPNKYAVKLVSKIKQFYGDYK